MTGERRLYFDAARVIVAIGAPMTAPPRSTSFPSSRGRIEHDLYYIDHWSLWLEIRILFLTLFSRQAYRNAY